MSRHIVQDAGEFFLAADRVPIALELLAGWVEDRHAANDDALPALRATTDIIASAVTGSRTPAEALLAVLELHRWDARLDADGNVVALVYTWDLDRGLHAPLTAIAPLVREGAYLQMHDENGRHWRWTFAGGRLQELPGALSFPAPAPSEDPRCDRCGAPFADDDLVRVDPLPVDLPFAAKASAAAVCSRCYEIAIHEECPCCDTVLVGGCCARCHHTGFCTECGGEIVEGRCVCTDGSDAPVG